MKRSLYAVLTLSAFLLSIRPLEASETNAPARPAALSLRFRGKMILPDNTPKFGIEIDSKEVTFLGLNEEYLGFKILKHEWRPVPSATRPLRSAVLTIQKDGKIFELWQNKLYVWSEEKGFAQQPPPRDSNVAADGPTGSREE